MPRPTRYAKGLAKREEILTVALEVIARTGYRRTSVKELANAVGLSQAGLLHYFASKEELFAEILALRDVVDENAAGERGESPIDALVSVVRHNAEVPGLVQLFAQFSVAAGDPEHPAHDAFVDRYARIRKSLAEDIAERQQAGTLPSNLDPVTAANLVIAAADGLQIQWLLDPELDMAEHLAGLVSLLGSAPVQATQPEQPR
ncbi:MAG: TetR/AcrR family transcriptional regulator [Propionibacteriaceae bacterium]|nr:TetR/AcrR family transcriptional regulator [Propionibacteriaceae bacterium]